MNKYFKEKIELNCSVSERLEIRESLHSIWNSRIHIQTFF